MTLEDTRALVIESLAEKTGKTVADLTAELKAAGSEYPYSSVWLVSAAARAARLMDVELKRVGQNTTAFKSVSGLATYLHDLKQQQQAA